MLLESGKLRAMNKQLDLIVLAVLIVALLIGQRLDLVFAGGNGFNRMLDISVAGMKSSVRRGETITTKSNERQIAQIGNTTFIGMDERTEIVLDNLFDGHLEIHLTKGRIMIETVQPLTVTTNATKNTITNGTATIINYDFLQTIDVIPLTADVSLKTKKTQSYSELHTAVRISEIDPYTITSTTFSLSEGVAADFYKWFLKQRSEMIPPPSISDRS